MPPLASLVTTVCISNRAPPCLSPTFYRWEGITKSESSVHFAARNSSMIYRDSLYRPLLRRTFFRSQKRTRFELLILRARPLPTSHRRYCRSYQYCWSCSTDEASNHHSSRRAARRPPPQPQRRTVQVFAASLIEPADAV